MKIIFVRHFLIEKIILKIELHSERFDCIIFYGCCYYCKLLIINYYVTYELFNAIIIYIKLRGLGMIKMLVFFLINNLFFPLIFHDSLVLFN